jgi:hypothetical protein
MYIINVESGQLTRVPPAPQAAAAAGGADAAARGGRSAAGGSMVFARDGRTLYFRSGNGLFAAPITRTRRGGAAAARPAAVDAAAVARRGRGAAADRRRPPTQTARQVTYTANIEVDHKALRAQVFNEGWRIMKNRFYDAKMHGADWNAAGRPTARCSSTSSTRKSCTPS